MLGINILNKIKFSAWFVHCHDTEESSKLFAEIFEGSRPIGEVIFHNLSGSWTLVNHIGSQINIFSLYPNF